MLKHNYRIGIIGGMGPMTGVFLQKLIIENTPALKDQDHIEVVCFTNPHIPDRTKSLQENGGRKFLAAIIDSIKVLERANVNCILIPCNTSHALFNDMQNASSVPVVNMVEITLRKIRESGVSCIGILATDGSIASRVFNADKSSKIIFPDANKQREVMNIIYEIKSGKYDDNIIASKIDALARRLKQRGAGKIILGCTDISIYFPLLKENNVIDPLVLLAKEAINMAVTTK